MSTFVLSPLGGAGAQFLDNSGNPLSGGKLYTYIAGTTTARTTYTTYLGSGGASHTNPIILDSAGRVPSGGEIWLDSTLAYKFLIATSADATLATWDNIRPAIYAIDSENITYLAPFTGSVSRTAEVKLSDWVSVKDFGAVGDDTANDAAAIQLALNTGKSVYLPAGTYNCFTIALTFTTAGQFLFGCGNTSILKSGLSNYFITTTGKNNTGVRNLKVVGNGTVTSAGTTAFYITGDSQNTVIDGVDFYQCYVGVQLGETDYTTVQNCTFDSGGFGVISTITGQSANHVSVIGNRVIGAAKSFVLANGTGAAPSFWNILNNDYNGSLTYPVYSDTRRFVYLLHTSNVVVANNTVNKVAGTAIQMDDVCSNVSITDNIFDNCIATDIGYIYLSPAIISTPAAKPLLISGNTFLRSDTALSAISSWAFWAEGEGGGSTSDTIQFTDNLVRGVSTALSGVHITSILGSMLISGNCFQGLSYALLTTTPNNNVVFEGNLVRACSNGVYASGLNSTNWLVSGNLFLATSGTTDITSSNTPIQWLVSGNIFSKKCLFSSGTDITVTGNAYASAADIDITATRGFRFNNVLLGSGGGGTTLCQDLRDYANDGAAAAGGIPVGGLYRNGSIVMVRVA